MKRKFEDMLSDDFKETMERIHKDTKEDAGKIVKNIPPSINKHELSLNSELLITETVKENKGIIYKPKLTVGNRYKIADFGDGFGLIDDEEAFRHIEDVELFHNMVIVKK